MKGPCSSVSPLLEKYFDREITDQEKVLVEGHLIDCLSCRDALRSMEALRHLMKVPVEEYPRAGDFERVWLKVQRKTRPQEKSSWREVLRSWFELPTILQKRVWVPAVSTLLILTFITVPLLFKKNSSLLEEFGVEYVESTTNNIMVYEIEKAKVTVIWLLEGPEGESTTS